MFRGSIVALVTPMAESGEVDFEAFESLLDWHAKQGTDGVVVLGTTGESPTVTADEGHELLRRAVPGYMVLAQVPLSRFVRVPTRHSYSEWLHRVGALSADLLVCDTGSRVLAVIDVRATDESSRSRRRHERLARVLPAAGVRVHVWREGHLASPAEVRTALAHDLVRGNGPMQPVSTSSRPMPLIPVPETQELDAILAAGDAAAADLDHEPVPSGFFEEMETSAPSAAR